MAISSGRKVSNGKLVHWGRLLLAVLAILIAATHLPYAGLSAGGGAPSSHISGSGSVQASGTKAQVPFGFQALGLWFEIETIAYTVIAVVFLLGIRRWYGAAAVFNAFNVLIYFLSGYTAIPGITTMAFGSRLAEFGSSLSGSVLMVSWIALLILSIVFLKYDKGSELEKEI